MDHSVDGFVNRSVAAEDDNEIRPGLDSVTGNAGCILRAGRRGKSRREMRKRRLCFLKELRISPKFAGCGVVDENRLPIRCDPSSITRSLRQAGCWLCAKRR